MENTMAAIEMTGSIDENHQLQLDDVLPVSGPMRVKVIVLYLLADEWDQSEWLRAAAHNPAFDSPNDPEEDIYSITDGEPFRGKESD
jgi:hypothetical protein